MVVLEYSVVVVVKLIACIDCDNCAALLGIHIANTLQQEGVAAISLFVVYVWCTVTSKCMT